MRIEMFIRKQLRMKAHWVTKVEATGDGLVAWVERLGRSIVPHPGVGPQSARRETGQK